jgi:hypothetical protein
MDGLWLFIIICLLATISSTAIFCFLNHLRATERGKTEFKAQLEAQKKVKTRRESDPNFVVSYSKTDVQPSLTVTFNYSSLKKNILILID